MTLFDFKKAVVNNVLGNFYIFTGEEFGVKKVYIDKIAEQRGLTKVYVDTLDEIWKELANKSLFGNGNLYITRDVSVIKDAKRMPLLFEGSYIQAGMLILVDDNNAKIKQYEDYEDCVVFFSQLSNDILSIYIKKVLETGSRHWEGLIDACNHSYTYLMFELEKIQIIMQERGLTAEGVLREIMASRTWFFTDAGDVIFTLIDKVMRLELETAFSLLKEAYEGGEHPLVIFTLIFNNLVNQLKYTGTKQKSMEAMGLNYYQFKNCQQYATIGWTARETLRVFEIARELEIGIKKGKYEPEMAVEYLFLAMGG